MSHNQIALKGDWRREEGLASGDVKPGMLLERTSATADTVKAHATEGGYHERAFAVADVLQGKEITDTYSDGDLVSYNLFEPGAVIQAWLKAGQSVTKGDDLISAGDGTLIANGNESSGTTVRQLVAEADETLDLSASGAVDTLMDVRVY